LHSPNDICQMCSNVQTFFAIIILVFSITKYLLSVYAVCFVVLADNLMHCIVYDTAVCLLGFFLYTLVIHLQLLIHTFL